MDLDEHDAAFVSSLIPSDAVPTGLLAVVTWLDPAGDQRWRVYTRMDMPISSTVGLLEMAKLRLLGQTPCGMPFAYTEAQE